MARDQAENAPIREPWSILAAGGFVSLSELEIIRRIREIFWVGLGLILWFLIEDRPKLNPRKSS